MAHAAPLMLLIRPVAPFRLDLTVWALRRRGRNAIDHWDGTTYRCVVVILLYLVLFAAFRFALFFVRGNVPVVALGLKNGQWTALAILVVAGPVLVLRVRRAVPMRPAM